MMKAARNCNKPPPMLATKPRAVSPVRQSLGCMLCTSAGRSAWAFDHTSWSFLADDRPCLDPGTRGWNLQRIVLHVVDQLTHRIAKRTHQHRRRHDDQHDANDDQQGGRKSLLAPDLAGQGLVERIERDGQDQRPDHQVQERGEDLVAQHGHGEDQAGTDQDIQQRDANRCSSS